MLPNYNDYVIYGNTVVLCEGRWPEKSQAACSWLVDRLDNQVERRKRLPPTSFSFSPFQNFILTIWTG